MLDPEVILYDEPSAGLDPVISSVIDELIIEMSEKIDATSIIVTHEMDSAFRIATRMAMLYQGKIHAEGTPKNSRSTRSRGAAVHHRRYRRTNPHVSAKFQLVRSGVLRRGGSEDERIKSAARNSIA